MPPMPDPNTLIVLATVINFFHVMYAVLPKIIAFWDVMQYILVGCNQRS
jgi:hypothetical protein